MAFETSGWWVTSNSLVSKQGLDGTLGARSSASTAESVGNEGKDESVE